MTQATKDVSVLSAMIGVAISNPLERPERMEACFNQGLMMSGRRIQSEQHYNPDSMLCCLYASENPRQRIRMRRIQPYSFGLLLFNDSDPVRIQAMRAIQRGRVIESLEATEEPFRSCPIISRAFQPLRSSGNRSKHLSCLGGSHR